MFAPTYFAPRYFAPRYWPPGIETGAGVRDRRRYLLPHNRITLDVDEFINSWEEHLSIEREALEREALPVDYINPIITLREVKKLKKIKSLPAREGALIQLLDDEEEAFMLILNNL